MRESQQNCNWIKCTFQEGYYDTKLEVHGLTLNMLLFW